MKIFLFGSDHIRISHEFKFGTYTQMDAFLCDSDSNCFRFDTIVAVYIHRYVDYKHVSNTRRFLKISEYAKILNKEFPDLAFCITEGLL